MLTIRLLGGVAVETGGRTITPPPARTHGLLALLLLDPHAHPRTRLAERLRPDLVTRTARQRLNSTLWLLRRTIPDLDLRVDDDVVVVPASSRRVDAEDLRRGLTAQDPQARAAAVESYRDRLLPDVEVPWVVAEREALHSEFLAGALDVASEWSLAGEHDRALAVLQRLCEREPGDEPLRRLLDVARAAGRHTIGLRAFERHERRLAGLGLAPDPAVVEAAAELAGPRARRAAVGEVASLAVTVPAGGSGATSWWARPELGEARRAMAAGDVDAADRALELAGHPHATLLRARLARIDGRITDSEGRVAAVPVDRGDELAAGALIERARLASRHGHGHRCMTYAGQALEIAAAAGLTELRCRAEIALAAEHVRSGRLAQASMVARRAASLGASLADAEASVECALLQAAVSAGRGDLAEAAARLDEALGQAQAGHRPDLVALTRVRQARLLRRAGWHDEARRELCRASSGATGGLPRRRPRPEVAVEQLAVLIDGSDDDDVDVGMMADPDLQQRCARDPLLAVRLVGLQGAVYQRIGRHEQAIEAFASAARAHRVRGEFHHAAATEASRAESLLGVGRVREARRATEHAGAVLDAGLVPGDLEPHIRIARADVARAQGDAARADVEAAAAADRLQVISANAPRSAAGRVETRDRAARRTCCAASARSWAPAG